MRMYTKRHRVILVSDLLVWAFACIVVGAVLGALAMQYLYDKHHVPLLALETAREQANAEMQAACSNWFTDKKARALPEGRIVVCRAPLFMSSPPRSTELK